jgi:hypothetical protein
MRTINFRAWDGEQLIYRGLHDRNWYTEYLGGKLVKGTHPDDNHFLKVMQFTNVYDAEVGSKEVFEDDIIENCDTKELQVVYWNEDEAAWYCRYVNDESRIVSLSDSLGNLNKVIGNIYENANLLQVVS